MNPGKEEVPQVYCKDIIINIYMLLVIPGEIFLYLISLFGTRIRSKQETSKKSLIMFLLIVTKDYKG